MSNRNSNPMLTAVGAIAAVGAVVLPFTFYLYREAEAAQQNVHNAEIALFESEKKGKEFRDKINEMNEEFRDELEETNKEKDKWIERYQEQLEQNEQLSAENRRLSQRNRQLQDKIEERCWSFWLYKSC